jgi:signal transduction histidine kinase
MVGYAIINTCRTESIAAMLSDRLRIRDIRNTSTFRLTVLFGLVFAVGVTALLGLIYGLSARELTSRSDRILRLEAALLEAVPPEALPERIRTEIARSASGLNYFELQTSDGERIAGNITVSPEIAVDRPRDMPPGAEGDRPIRLLAIRMSTGETLLIGRDITPIVDLRKRVLAILVWSGLAIALAVLVSGIALSLAPLRRVRDLQRTSREIAAGDMEARMPLMGRGDELDLFAGTVNSMVEEVGRVIAQVKGVTDAVAHDLRTPLTRVRSQLYRVRQAPGVETQTAAMIEAATQDLDVVLERFAALLRISELEASGRRAGFGTIDLDALIESIRDLYDPLAEDRAVTLDFVRSGGACVRGDGKLLFEALSNLVDNAIKFVPVGGRVLIALAGEAGAPVIEVRDDGRGIAVDERRAVLRRFHRGADAGDVPGSGLGLSVVAAIVHLHGFVLEFDDGNPGLIVRIRCGHDEPAIARQ